MKESNIKKFTRILNLLNKLDSGTINLMVESKELGFSVRTLERDIQEIENAGFPLRQIAPGRYALLEGFSLNKLPLSARDEALLKLIGQLADTLGPQWADSYQRLLKRSARPQGKEIYFVKMPRMWHTLDQKILTQLEQAILKNTLINLHYQTPARRVWCNCLRPLKIALFDGFWYLICLNNKNSYMKFSVGKILAVCPQKETFSAVDIDSVLQQTPNIWFDVKGAIQITCRIDASVARYFKEVEFFPHQKIEKEEKNGDLILSCRTDHAMQVLPQIKHWLPHIRILAPAELNRSLRQELLDYAQSLAD